MWKVSFFEKLLKRFSMKKTMFSWYRHYKLLFFLGFLIVFGYGGFSWYQHLYQYQWSDESKKQFLETNFKETVFQESTFKDTVARLKKQTRIHEESPALKRDIFTGQTIK